MSKFRLYDEGNNPINHEKLAGFSEMMEDLDKFLIDNEHIDFSDLSLVLQSLTQNSLLKRGLKIRLENCK